MSKHILITKPKDQNEKLKAALNKEGFEVSVLPCLEIEKIDYQTPCFTSEDIVFFMSPNAVKYFNESVQGDIYAVGPTTQQQLKTKNINATIPKEFSSEGLLELDTLKNVAGKKVFIICGQNPKLLLGEVLTQRKAIVKHLPCYRRWIPRYSKEMLERLTQQSINLIIATSQESLKNLDAIFSAYRHWLNNQNLVVISHAMEELARLLGFTCDIARAKNPTNEAIVDAVLTLYNRNNRD